MAGTLATLKGHPQLTQTSSHQQHFLHRLSFSSQPVHAQGALLREIKPCARLTFLLHREAEELNLTWLHGDHSHHLENQVSVIDVILERVFDRGGVKDDENYHTGSDAHLLVFLAVSHSLYFMTCSILFMVFYN